MGRGAITSSQREVWHRRYAQDSDLTREVLESLPGDAARADRAYAEDERLRALGDAFDSYMGVALEEDRADQDPDAIHDPTNGLFDFS